jgi:large subunit ribosomal protein L10
MQRAQKEQVVASVSEEFANVVSIVLADFRGVDVETVTAIRRDFQANGCQYRVIKNTLVKIAVKGGPMEPMSALLKGPTAVIWSNESPSMPAKIALKHAKDHAAFTVKGGFFEGQLLDPAGVASLSKMPGRQELQASLLMTFMAAPTDFVRLMAAAPTNFLYVLQARERQLNG